jgi:hypothetical protein
LRNEGVKVKTTIKLLSILNSAIVICNLFFFLKPTAHCISGNWLG